ncbi:hypothetical protein ILUMI_15167 [Ignelater luminosus]|uniref:Uncharacterized protein n=1 Tax=Ignelater luminosus TaxID=2038154 RepID=A0A8K0CSU2_IGNLU|nr:hypothetical protein ILUMI_15167 [Ignelater luminosus]
MIICTEKTKCMTITKDPLRCKLIVEDKPIELISQFKYLGVELFNDHDPPKELRRLIDKEKLYGNRHIYKTCVRPIETREETNKTKSMLRVAKMNIQRTIIGKTKRERVRNTEVREQCGVQDIRWERQRRRQWYNHVKRMKEERIPRGKTS